MRGAREHTHTHSAECRRLLALLGTRVTQCVRIASRHIALRMRSQALTTHSCQGNPLAWTGLSDCLSARDCGPSLPVPRGPSRSLLS